MTDEEAFKYQLDILKIEIDQIEKAIERFDQIAQTTKNWAIVTWAGSIAIALSNSDLRDYIIVTFILPILFWFIDAWFRRLQARSIVRNKRISEFLNSDIFFESFKQHRFVNFLVLDPVGSQHRGEKQYEQRIRICKIIFYPEIAGFYGGLTSISILLSIVINL